MSTHHTINCNICDTVKKESNHWWEYLELAGVIVVVPMQSYSQDSKHACGISCVQAAVARFCEHSVSSHTASGLPVEAGGKAYILSDTRH